MPLKVILAETLSFENHDEYYDEYIEYFCLQGQSCMAIGYCSDTLRKITPATRLKFKNNLQQKLWNTYLNKLEFPEEFFVVSNYSSAASSSPDSENYAGKRGFVAYDQGNEWYLYPVWETGLLDKQEDLRNYLISMVTRTSEEWASDLTYPLVKQKYDILRNWIRDKYGVDIKEIGDKVYE